MRSLNIALTRRFISAALIITALGTLSGCQLKENFDGVTPPALPFGWTTSGTNGAWVTVANTTPDRPSDSGANSAFVAAANNQDVSLVTPSMSIPSSGAAQLSFKHRCKTEPNFDGGILEISQNGGGFQNITAVGTFLTGAYTGPLNTAPFGVSPAWNNEQNYVSSTVSLNVTEGSTLKLRFRSVSDNTVQGTGCSVDTVSLDGADLVVTKTDSKDPVLLDGNFVYTITVRNNGALNASNVLLYDVLPLGFQYVSTSLSQGSMLVSTPPVLYASLGNISSGAQAVMTVTGTAPNAAPHAPALAVTSPSTLTRTMIAGDAAFGPALNQTGVGGEVILANDGSGDSEDACQNLAPNFAAGKVLLVRQSGVCSFNQQTKTAQNAGAVGVVVYSNSSEGVIAMGSSGLAVNIPALFYWQYGWQLP
ncbi:MAG: DUF11 domain-containing protein [Oligoflexia bacterium]|nr:DUF11 domain-containing protein [Oligoflexia bacterium]